MLADQGRFPLVRMTLEEGRRTTVIADDVRELYRRLSPIVDAAKVSTPTLFVVGEHDYRVPLPQSEQFYLALRTLGVETALIIYPNQAHGIVRPSYQTDRLRRYEFWYDEHLRGRSVDPIYEGFAPAVTVTTKSRVPGRLSPGSRMPLTWLWPC